MANFVNLQEDTFASRALTFLVRGMSTELKNVIAYFTGDVMHLLSADAISWKVVSTSEISLNLMVIAAVNDGASLGRKFSHLHGKLATDLECDVVKNTISFCNVTSHLPFFRFSFNQNYTQLPVQLWLRTF